MYTSFRRFMRELNPLNDNTGRFSPRDVAKSLVRGGAVGLVAGGVYGALCGDDPKDVVRCAASGSYYGLYSDFLQYTLRSLIEYIY